MSTLAPVAGTLTPATGESAAKSRTANGNPRCGACGRHWTGLAEAHFSVCHRHFSAGSTFDSHQRDGQCLNPSGVNRPDGTLLFAERQRVDGSVWVRHSESPREWEVAA